MPVTKEQKDPKEQQKKLRAELHQARELLREVRRVHKTAFHLTRDPGPRMRGLRLMDDIDTFLTREEN